MHGSWLSKILQWNTFYLTNLVTFMKLCILHKIMLPDNNIFIFYNSLFLDRKQSPCFIMAMIAILIMLTHMMSCDQYLVPAKIPGEGLCFCICMSLLTWINYMRNNKLHIKKLNLIFCVHAGHEFVWVCQLFFSLTPHNTRCTYCQILNFQVYSSLFKLLVWKINIIYSTF